MDEHPKRSDDDETTSSPTELTKPSWTYLIRRAIREFSRDQLNDKAAALTYYSVLSLFPALIALVSILGLVGQRENTTDTLMDLVDDIAPSGMADQLQGPIQSITQNPGAGLGLVLGLLVALWTASKYVSAFSRAMNDIYGVAEGRPFWKQRPLMYVLTVVLIVLVALAALMLVVSGPIARSIGDVVGLGSPAVTVWSIARWPVLVLVAIVVIALLYYFTPNIKPPKFRWVSAGAVVALLSAAAATALLLVYLNVAGGDTLNRTYGSLGGVIAALLWLWVMNLMLLFGAGLDAELERVRELQDGQPAEEQIQLPPRDTTKIIKDRARYAELVAQARVLRRTEGEHLEAWTHPGGTQHPHRGPRRRRDDRTQR